MQNYEIIKAIGNGAYGNVLLAKHKLQDRSYAIKRIKFQDVQQTDRVSIRNQVKILQTLKHPNLVPYKDSIMDNEGYLNIILAYCEGGDMYKRIKNVNGKNFMQEQVLDWLCQICLALYFMHDNKILHRDLKPQNIFLKDGRVLLGDFGISKILDSTVELASTCIGTPYYMSPDLYKYNKYSYKADIWALGCVLYQLCNLRLPFQANSQVALSVKVMKGHYSPITSTYSKPLRQLIHKMLSLDAKERPYIYQILRKPFIKKRVQSYVGLMVKKVEIGQQTKQQIFLDKLIDQAYKLGITHDSIKDDKQDLVTRITSTPSLKSHQQKQQKQQKLSSRISREKKAVELLEQKLNSLDKDSSLSRLRQQRKHRKSVHESNTKRDSSLSLDKKQKQKQKKSMDKRQRSIQKFKQKQDIAQVDHRSKVLMQKQRKQRQKRQHYHKEFQQLNRQNSKNRQMANEKHKAQYRVSQPITKGDSKPQFSISEDKRMQQQDDGDYQQDQQVQNIFQIDELQQQQQQDVQLLKSYISNQLKQKTIKLSQLNKEKEMLAKSSQKLQQSQQEDFQQPLHEKVNPSWLKINDRTKLLRHRCQVGIGLDHIQKATIIMAKGLKPQQTKQALTSLLGQQNIGYWHLLEQLQFYEQLQKSIPIN